MRVQKSCLLLMVLALISGTGAYAKDPDIKPLDRWMGIYDNGEKIGYSHETRERVTFEGKACFKRTLVTQIGPSPACVRYINVFITDVNFSPLYESDDITAPDTTKNKKAEIRYRTSSIECQSESNGKITKQSISIPEGTDMKTSVLYDFDLLRPAPGKTLVMMAFNNNPYSLVEHTVYYGKRQNIQLNGTTCRATPLYEKVTSSVTVNWYLDNGKLAKVGGIGESMYLLTEPKEEATKGL